MLINITFTNMFSYDAATTFSMQAGKITKQHRNHVTKVSGIPVLRGAIVYGPNAAGKSNFLKAVSLLATMLGEDSCHFAVGQYFKLTPKICKTLSWSLDFSYNGEVFRYQIETDGESVGKERLTCFTDAGEELMFSRTNLKVEFGKDFTEDPWYGARTFRSSCFLIRKLYQDGICERSETIKNANRFVNAIYGLQSIEVLNTKSAPIAQGFGNLLQMDDFKIFLKQILRVADLGIEDVVWRRCVGREASEIIDRFMRQSAEKQPGVRFFAMRGSLWCVMTTASRQIAFELRFVHKGVPMRMSEESEGTLRLFDLSVFLYSLKTEQKTWLVDEIDCHMHSFVTYKMLHEFMEMPDVKSQVIVTAHDTMLMNHEIWRTDEVWFSEKRMDGSSDLYSLYQYTPRFDKKLEKGYRQGLYGAIPHLGGEMLNG